MDPKELSGGFVAHEPRPARYAFIHIERAGKRGESLGDGTNQYGLWGLPKDSYVGPFEKNSDPYRRYVADRAYRMVAVEISPR